MHHYMTHTEAMLNEPAQVNYDAQLWQVEVPKAAFESDFLLHALLGFAALHKAQIEQTQAIELRASAVAHLDRALMLYRDQGCVTNAGNAAAKLLFGWIVVLFAYAIPPALPPVDASVELVLLVKGIDTVLSETWFWVSQGPFASVLTQGFQEVPLIPEDSPIFSERDYSLDHLDFMLVVDEACFKDTNERNTCQQALDELRLLYDSVLCSLTPCSVNTILCWPKHDSATFAALLSRRCPPALVLLTFHCVLLHVLNARWWMRGWAPRLLSSVLNSLDEHWRDWAEWPARIVLAGQRRPSLEERWA